MQLRKPLADNNAKTGENLGEVVGQKSPERAHEAHSFCRLLIPVEAMHGVLWLEYLLRCGIERKHVFRCRLDLPDVLWR